MTFLTLTSNYVAILMFYLIVNAFACFYYIIILLGFLIFGYNLKYYGSRIFMVNSLGVYNVTYYGQLCTYYSSKLIIIRILAMLII